MGCSEHMGSGASMGSGYTVGFGDPRGCGDTIGVPMCCGDPVGGQTRGGKVKAWIGRVIARSGSSAGGHAV